MAEIMKTVRGQYRRLLAPCRRQGTSWIISKITLSLFKETINFATNVIVTQLFINTGDCKISVS